MIGPPLPQRKFSIDMMSLPVSSSSVNNKNLSSEETERFGVPGKMPLVISATLGGDIFAHGVMVVEALTGCRPFVGRTAAELMAFIVGSAFHLEGKRVK